MTAERDATKPAPGDEIPPTPPRRRRGGGGRIWVALPLLVSAVAALGGSGPAVAAPSSLGPLVVPAKNPRHAFEERTREELKIAFGDAFTYAAVVDVRCPESGASYDRYYGVERDCPYEFGRAHVRWTGSVRFYSDNSDGYLRTFNSEAAAAKPYGLRERRCSTQRFRSWPRIKRRWRIATLRASNRGSHYRGCEDATEVLKHVVFRSSSRRLIRSTSVAAYSSYGTTAFGPGLNPWACRARGRVGHVQTVTCKNRLDHTFTATLRPRR